MVSALVSESCGDDDKGLMSRLAEMFMVDGYNQRKPVRVVAYEESETLQLYVDEANMTIKQVLHALCSLRVWSLRASTGFRKKIRLHGYGRSREMCQISLGTGDTVEG